MRHVVGLAIFLILIGLTAFWYKSMVLGFPLVAETQSLVWTAEATVSFKAGQGPVKVNMQIPERVPGFSVFDENFVSQGYGLTTKEGKNGRSAQWAIRRAQGKQTLYYRAVVYEDPTKERDQVVPPFPSIPTLEEPYNTALLTLAKEVRERSADIETFTAEMLAHINDPSPDQYIDLFLADRNTPLARTQLAVTLLAGARIPARVAHGIYLQDHQRNTPIIPWLQVHNGKEWLYFDPQTGKQGMPDDFFVWWRGNEALVTVEGGGNVDIQLAVQKNQLDTMLVAERRAVQLQSNVVDFSLFSLPIQTQAVYSVLLMIPIGAFVIVILRNVIGIRTFGTFMPVLIALAFRETQLLWGIMLFTTLIAMGLAIRFYLEKLRLLLVPRLSAILIVVVLLMVMVSIVSHHLGLDTGLSIALFPMVIMAMVIERMSIVWEERGPGEAIKEGAGSLAAAALAYLLMGNDMLEHLVFVFPELLLVILAVILLLGRYTGYRVSELFRFKAFGRETP